MLPLTTHFLAAIRDPAEGRVVSEALNRLGFDRVTAVVEGESALSLMENDAPDVVIAAWDLPGLGGLRLVKTVRSLEHRPYRPCVIVVPERHESELNMIDEVKVEGLLIRPLTEAGVMDVIRRLGDNSDADAASAVERADALAAAGRHQEALAEYERAREEERRAVAELHLNVGAIHQRQGRLDAAVEEFERAAAAAPGDVDAHLALGRACLRAGRIDKADQALSRAADIEPVGQDRLKFQIADALLENGRPDRAADIFTDLLDHRPQNPVLLNRMGVVRRRQGDHRKALEYYKRALELTPNDEHLLFNMGRCHYELGHKERAAEFLNQALTIAPDFEAARHLLDRVS